VGHSRRADLTVDSTGAAHIRYFDDVNDDLRYAYRNPGGVWTTRTVEREGLNGMRPNGISADPRFVSIANPAEADLHLRASSPALGRGTDGSDLGAYPFAGAAAHARLRAGESAGAASEDEASGCSVGGGGTRALPWALAAGLFALAVRRRRRGGASGSAGRRAGDLAGQRSPESA